MMRTKPPLFVAPLLLFFATSICGCQWWWIDDADREVASLIQKRQQAALGMTADAYVGDESGLIGGTSDPYSFVPSPIDSVVPERFRAATTTVPEDADGESVEARPRNASPDGAAEGIAQDVVAEPAAPRPFTLSDALAYAMRHARIYQTEKELLYLSALDLTLERYLWTPRFINSVLSLDYDNAGQVADFDQALTAVADFAVQQRLRYGGEITARVINTLMRDLSNNVTSGESGQFIVDARLPLLRGAGRVAYENRYQAERDLIYAVRGFERFRREFLVGIASDYFDLLSLKTRIESAQVQASSVAQDYEREQALADAELKLQFEADRAQVSMLRARNTVIDAQENYDNSLDSFKIRLGMPTSEAIDVVDEMVDLVDPRVPLGRAIETGLKYRLDLLTVRDGIDDARRQVEIARNNLLPQVDLRGGVTLDTDPDRPNTSGYNTERISFSAGVDVEIPLDRKRQRNSYRGALIGLRRSERDYEEFADRVRLQVRRALRRLARTRSTIEIQQKLISINEFRAALVRAKLIAGELSSTIDVVDAENDLRDARNSLAEAEADFRRAVLEFLRDTGTLRVGDDGKWARYDVITGEPVASAGTPPQKTDNAAAAGP
ncbi:MAG: TolC family protein [Phycisphaerae bacterium]